jgi:transposase
LRSRIPPLEEPSVRKQHVVVLPEPERARLHTLIGQGTAPARALAHARILLKANQGEAGPGWTDRAIAAALEVHHTTVARVRQQYAAGGLEAAVDRKAPEREYRRKLDGQQEAHLVALACSTPPEGRKRWTLRLLADRLVELEVVDAVSYETVRQALKQPAQAVADPALVHPAAAGCRVLLADGGRARGLHPTLRPPAAQVCLDETSRQLLAQVTPPMPVAPGRPAREDYEYERRGVCNLFLVCEPLAGWRDVMVSARRTRIDWAHCVKELVDVCYPDAERVVLVHGNPEHPHARVAGRGV